MVLAVHSPFVISPPFSNCFQIFAVALTADLNRGPTQIALLCTALPDVRRMQFDENFVKTPKLRDIWRHLFSLVTLIFRIFRENTTH